jgi:hypothetical protein
MDALEKYIIKAIIEKVESINANQKKVEKKELEDYLLEKKQQGRYDDNKISFIDSDDYSYFEALISNLGIDIDNLLK